MLWKKGPASGKPPSPLTTVCPLLRERQCDACHNCAFWIDFPVVVDGKEMSEWSCAVIWNAKSGPILAKRLDGVQKACESLRNRFAEFRDSSLRLVAQVAGVSAVLPPPPAQPLLEGPDASQ